jgi:hypothetical protein
MDKDKIDGKLVGATIFLVICVLAAGSYFLFKDVWEQGGLILEDVKDVNTGTSLEALSSEVGMSSSRKSGAVKVAEKKKRKKRSSPVTRIQKPIEKKGELTKPVSEKIEVVKKKVPKAVAVRRIEKTLLLNKPKTPRELRQYIPLVYSSMREIARYGDYESALKWAEEGMYYSKDGSFSAFASLLSHHLEREEISCLYAEGVREKKVRLDMKAKKLGESMERICRGMGEKKDNIVIWEYL